MHGLLVGTTVLAAFLGGTVALFAPCCISVMLPAYLATGLQRRRQLVAMTFVFAAGIATVILPISFGATALSRLINGQHTIVYSVMAAAMLAMGAAMVLGMRLPMPMLGMASSAANGPGRAFVLGAFSGVATACCAPVLAGVVALSGAAGSFVTALVIGVAYVFGMVAPLFVMALIWDRRHDGGSRPISPRSVRVRLFRRPRQVPLSSFLGGLLLVVMGALVAVLAVTGPNMATTGWQATLASELQHVAHKATVWFGHIPGVVTLLVLLGTLSLLARLAIRQAASRTADDHLASEPQEGDDSGDMSPPQKALVPSPPQSLNASAPERPDPEPALQKG